MIDDEVPYEEFTDENRPKFHGSVVISDDNTKYETRSFLISLIFLLKPFFFSLKNEKFYIDLNKSEPISAFML